MRPKSILAGFSALSLPFVASAPVEERASCSFAQKVAGIQHEIDTIVSHSFKDANLIPLAALASRTFFVTLSKPVPNVRCYG